MCEPQLDLKICPIWDLIDPTREYLRSLFSICFEDEELASRVCLTAHELLENAIKYSSVGEVAIRFGTDGAGCVWIEVENCAQPEHVPPLVAEVEAVMEAGDPMAYYVHKMERSLTGPSEASGLGLARIRSEAGMRLHCATRDGRIFMQAVSERPVPPRAGREAV